MTVSSFPIHRAAASLSTPPAPAVAPPARQARWRVTGGQPLGPGEPTVRAIVQDSSPAAPWVLAAALCLVALLVAPEQPRDQEAICQRHNGVAACRVW